MKASTKGRSYAEASELLSDLGDIEVSAKQCERVTQRIGRERMAERQKRLQAFEQLPLPQQRQPPRNAPANDWSGRVAAILMDGGRAQLRDERWGTPREAGEKKRRWWREPKVSCLATFLSRPQARDPLPEIPACLLDPLWIIPRIIEIKRTRRGDASEADSSQDVETADDSCSSSESSLPILPRPKEEFPRWSPEPLVRSVVATFGSYQQLGRLTRVEAWQRGFDAAPRKAFLGDGHRSNWSTRDEEFSTYVPITDLMHALSYVYTAAVESSPDMDEAWARYCRWATALWQGRGADMLSELKPLATVVTDRESAEKIQKCVTYLSNNLSRMHYNQYRQQGLPITTTLIESTIKQINRRMKGTEKFWEQGAEAQLQLCADQLSQTGSLTAFWQRRASTQTGFRNRCAKA